MNNKKYIIRENKVKYYHWFWASAMITLFMTSFYDFNPFPYLLALSYISKQIQDIIAFQYLKLSNQIPQYHSNAKNNNFLKPSCIRSGLTFLFVSWHTVFGLWFIPWNYGYENIHM